MKVAIITFHASHNYGSMLQAHALQQVVKNLGHECLIIHLRTPKQQACYPMPRDLRRLPVWKKIIYYVLYGRFMKDMEKKYLLFERFLRNDMQLTGLYTSLGQLEKELPAFDFYIAGSDQLWNTICADFDWSYFLPFAHRDKGICLSYAASMGPNAEAQISPQDKIKIKELLPFIKEISVREEGTARLVEELTGRTPQIHVDPTLLLPAAYWKTKIKQSPLVAGKYILLYTPSYNKDVYKTADRLSRLLHLPVIISKYMHQNLAYFNFKTVCDVGPWEFLNLIQHATLVVSGSFHAVVFSMMLRIPFFAVNGMKDNRMSDLLEKTHLQNRSIEMNFSIKNTNQIFDINFESVDEIISKERQRSIDFLTNALSQEDDKTL